VGRTSDGSTVPLGHTADRTLVDIDHERSDAVTAIDGRRMDGFDQITGAIQNGQDVALSRYHQSDIPIYWTYAHDFTLDDHFFSTIASPTFPNHLVLVAGSSNNIDDNPVLNSYHSWGCDAGPYTKVDAVYSIRRRGHTTGPSPASTSRPCRMSCRRLASPGSTMRPASTNRATSSRPSTPFATSGVPRCGRRTSPPPNSSSLTSSTTPCLR
jgi:hypothetical protein